MGLRERRKQRDIETKTVAKWLADLQEKTEGATNELVYEVDWPTFMNDPRALDSIWSDGDQPIYAIARIAQDERGRDLVRERVKRVVLRNVPRREDMDVTFADGVLTVAMCLGDMNGTPGTDVIQRVLENAL